MGKSSTLDDWIVFGILLLISIILGILGLVTDPCMGTTDYRCGPSTTLTQ